jgi:MFS family permease
MIFTQGALGYGLTSVMGAVVLEIFQGKQYGSIFGTIMLAALAGGAAGPLTATLSVLLTRAPSLPARPALPPGLMTTDATGPRRHRHGGRPNGGRTRTAARGGSRASGRRR